MYVFINFAEIYIQPHAIHLKVIMLKKMNNCLKYYICIFITFIFRKIFI